MLSIDIALSMRSAMPLVVASERSSIRSVRTGERGAGMAADGTCTARCGGADFQAVQ